MLAETVLVAFAAAAALFKAQQIYGQSYERRTERLRSTQDAFYAAAHAMLENPELDARHLQFVKTATRHVGEGNRARLHLRVLKRVIQEPITDAEREATAAIPQSLKVDLAYLMRTTLFAIAERQPLWRGALLRAFAKADKKVGRSPEHAAIALETAGDDGLMTPA